MSKIKVLLFNFGLLTLAYIFMSYNANPPDGKTGAPGEGTCGDCHSGGSSTADVEILGLPSTINANEAYNITVRVTKTGGSATKAGFQLVALNSSNQNIGDLTALSSDHGTTFLGSKEYVDQRNGKAFSANVAEWTFKWTAPNGPNGTNITLYGIANLCNGNNNTSGDNFIKTNASGQLMVNTTPLELSMTSTDVTCFGAANGQATAIPSGGTQPYTYAWSNGKTTQTITNLSPGTYSVTVTDNDGQKATDQVSITQPAALTVSLNSGILNCIKTDHTIKATTGGGTQPYTYLWSTFESSEELNVDEPGQYSVVVTDANGCTKSASVIITQDIAEPLVEIEDPALISCSNPVVQLAANVTPASALLSWTTNEGHIISGKNTSKPQVDKPGTYTLTATNPANGCVTITSVTVDGVSPVVAQAAVTDVLCHGDSTGAISVSATGGLPPYTFKWSTGETSPSIDSLKAGFYTIIINDASTCSDTLTVEVKQAAKLIAVVSSTGLSGPGADDGTATVVPQGGTPAYSVIWSTGDTTLSITNLKVGSYSVTLTDASNCQTSESVFINPFDCGISVNIQKTDVNCHGGNNGSACVEVNGGTAPFSYAWSVNDTVACLSQLTAGSYSVTVTDAAGCVVVNQVIIASPDAIALPASNIIITGESAFGAGDASVVVSATGGVPPYQYLFDGGASDGSKLSAGNHTVAVTDSLGCTAVFNFFVNPYPCDTLGIQSVSLAVETSCYDQPVKISVTDIQGGVPEYSYWWNNGSTDSTVIDFYNNLDTLIITDSKNCSYIQILDIDQPDSIFVNFNITDATPGAADGSIITSVFGGQAPYSLIWQNGSTSGGIDGLSPGIYCVTVTDSEGCSVVKCAEVKLKVATTELSSAGWKIFPVPARDFIYLQQALPDYSAVSWSVIDAVGTPVINGEQQSSSGIIPIQLGNLPSGQYYLLLRHQGRQHYARFIVR